MTDHELVRQCRRGLPQGLAELYARHGGTLLRLATRITGSRAEAEDILHDLFVALPELLGRYDERGRLDAWLRGVIARMAIDRMRREKRRELAAAANASTEDATTTLDPVRMVDIERAIGSLSPADRAVLVLRHFEGYSHDETAEFLDISSGAVRVRYLRALRRLRQLLESNR